MLLCAWKSQAGEVGLKAAQINGYGSADVVRVNVVDIPRVTKGKVLLDVHASSINPFDTRLRPG